MSTLRLLFIVFLIVTYAVIAYRFNKHIRAYKGADKRNPME